jgi:hypothetical protein
MNNAEWGWAKSNRHANLRRKNNICIFFFFFPCCQMGNVGCEFEQLAPIFFIFLLFLLPPQLLYLTLDTLHVHPSSFNSASSSSSTQ